MPLINCKVELKLRWTKHCVLASTGIEKDGGNSDNNISISKTQNSMFLSSLYKQKIIKNY